MKKDTDIIRATAHDINNALMGCMGHIQSALRDVPAGSPEQKKLQKSLAGIKHASALVHSLRTLGVANYQKHNFVNIAREAIELFEGHLSQDIELIFTPCVEVTLFADKEKMISAIINLLLNAQESISGRGTIHLSMRKHDALGSVDLQIADTGCGISQENVQQIYDKGFSTSSIEGKGYGLQNVKHDIELHHGSIACKSKPGMGTTFTVSLPIHKDTECTVPTKIIENATVVVFDASHLLAESLEELLESVGIQVMHYDSIDEGIERGLLHNASLCIVHEDNTGITAGRSFSQLQSHIPDVPIIISSYHFTWPPIPGRKDSKLHFAKWPLDMKQMQHMVLDSMT